MAIASQSYVSKFSLKNLEVSQPSNTFQSQHEFQNKALRIPTCNPQQDKIHSVCASGKTSDRERGEEDSLHSSIPLLLAWSAKTYWFLLIIEKLTSQSGRNREEKSRWWESGWHNLPTCRLKRRNKKLQNQAKRVQSVVLTFRQIVLRLPWFPSAKQPDAGVAYKRTYAHWPWQKPCAPNLTLKPQHLLRDHENCEIIHLQLRDLRLDVRS